MKGYQKYIVALIAGITLVACSRKKDTFLSRNFHAVAGEYNSLYNGEVAFDKGTESLALTYEDNFWDILPIERMETKDNIVLPGEEPQDPNFNRAEEKATKSIQKHSMYIDGRERNPQTDEAYLLLGKSRYFDQRFIPALDAFNFILNRYPTSNNINKANVWRAKTQIRLDNEDLAVRSLKNMLFKSNIDDEDIADASAMIAQGYIKMDSLPQALKYMKDAAALVKNNELKGRYLYIKGQLYQALDEIDSSNMAFDEVIALNRQSPRRYFINAHLAEARNFDYEKGDKVALLEKLEKMQENRENRPFLDKIYHHLAEYHRFTKAEDTAIAYYNKSIRKTKRDKILQSKNYNTLAELYFDRAAYKTAGAYYDSTLTQLEERTRLYRRIKKKRENLDDVITYEDIAKVNDSVLRLANMSQEDRLAYFVDYTDQLRAKAKEDSIAKAKLAKKGGVGDDQFFKNKEQENQGGPFYFYNNTTLSFGRQEFSKIWGDRPLTDNWRISSKQSNRQQDQETQAEKVTTVAVSELFDPQKYMELIPTDQKVLDSLTKDRDFAYYQLGLIYKEKFKEYELASNRLEKLLTYQPEERLILPSKYNLFKIYEILENPSLAAQYKQDILTNHADSRYAEILRNPNSQLATDESSPEFKYKQLYKKFENDEYQTVIDMAEEYITTYNGNDIVPKLELLKATAIGKQQGFEAYKKALNYVALTYPNNEEGKQAQLIYSSTLPKLEFKQFFDDENSSRFNIVYQFKTNQLQQANDLKKLLDEIIEVAGYGLMSTSIDYYDPNTRLLVVHGLTKRLKYKSIGDDLVDEKRPETRKYKITQPSFQISSENYTIVQIHKNLDAYLNPVEETLPKEEQKK